MREKEKDTRKDTSTAGNNQVTKTNGFSQDSELLSNLMCQFPEHAQNILTAGTMLTI